MLGEANRVLAVALGRDVGTRLPVSDGDAQLIRVITLISQQHGTGCKMPVQVLRAHDVAGLARRELEEDRSALAIDEGVELGGEPRRPPSAIG
jgi:hypothetical protein